MNFIYPGFLFALSALSIPVIIHLFNFRKFKKIYFTNVRFLQEIKQDTKSRSRLKHLLILLARLLAVTFLVFAFAQPYFPVTKKSIVAGSNNVSIYIDNSFSMDAVSKNGSLIEVAKKKAREVAMAYKPTDRFQLLTNDFEGMHQRLVNRDEALQLIDEVKASAAVKTLSEVISRQTEAMNIETAGSKTAKFAYDISDFQKTITDAEEIKSDSALNITLIPVTPSVAGNLFLDTCFVSTPYIQLNTPNELTVRIKNISEKVAENIPVKLSLNGIQKALTSVTLQSNATAEIKLLFTVSEAGLQQGVVSLTDYPVTFDDSYYFSFHVKEHLQILAVNGNEPSAYINALYGSDAYFILKNASVNQIDYSSLSANQLIVLNNIKEISTGFAHELSKYVKQSGTLFIFPTEDADMNSYKAFLESCDVNYFTSINTDGDKVTKIEQQHPLFSDVFDNKKTLPENMDLPMVKKYFIISKTSKSKEETLMKLQSGNTFLSITPGGMGRIYLCAVPLNDEFSNFPKHALFVPVMLKSVLQGASEISAPLIIGRDNEFIYSDSTFSGENIFHLVNSELKFDIIPESRLINNKTVIAVHEQVLIAGNYKLMNNNKILSYISFNYDRKESDLNCYNEKELQTLIEKNTNANITLLDAENKNITHAITQMSEGIRLWKYCIMLVLLFIGAEILLIRFMKS